MVFQCSPAAAKKGGKWEGWIWRSHERPADGRRFPKSERARRNQEIRRSPEMVLAKRECRRRNRERYQSEHPVCEKCRAHRGHFLPWKRRDDHVAHWLPLSRFRWCATMQWNLMILCDHHNVAQRDTIGLPWHWINGSIVLLPLRPVFRLIMWARTGVW